MEQSRPENVITPCHIPGVPVKHVVWELTRSSRFKGSLTLTSSVNRGDRSSAAFVALSSEKELNIISCTQKQTAAGLLR
jgi:hypothetical protein